MNIFKYEYRKLKRVEKSLNVFTQFKNPNVFDFDKIWKKFKILFEFGDDLSGKAYYKLYRLYGNSNNNIYKEKINLYAFYSKKIKCWLKRKTLTAEQANILKQEFETLKERIKIAILNGFGEEQYKKFYNSHLEYFK